MLLIALAFSVIAVLSGLVARTTDGASGLMFPLFVLPFFSSGFAPIESMTEGVRWFAEHQPMTPIIDTVRALMLGLPTADTAGVALAWLAGIIVLGGVASVFVYHRRVS
jgi:ABC-2 type transport system permease protein